MDLHILISRYSGPKVAVQVAKGRTKQPCHTFLSSRGKISISLKSMAYQCLSSFSPLKGGDLWACSIFGLIQMILPAMCYPHRSHGRLKLIDLIFSFNIFNHRQWLTMVNSSYLGKSSPFQGFYSCYSCPMANKSPWHDEVLKQWQWSLEVSISQARSSSAALLPRQRWKMWWSLGVNRDRMGK